MPLLVVLQEATQAEFTVYKKDPVLAGMGVSAEEAAAAAAKVQAMQRGKLARRELEAVRAESASARAELEAARAELAAARAAAVAAPAEVPPPVPDSALAEDVAAPAVRSPGTPNQHIGLGGLHELV